MNLRGLILLIALSVHSVALAQGTIYFSTRVAGAVNAPVWYLGEPADGRFVGQLYVSAPGGTLAPAGSPTPFRSDAGRGYITEGGIVTVPGVLPGERAQAKVVAWASFLGASYAEAVAKNQGGVGESLPITIWAGGGLLPPAALIGLSAFTISTVPEPSSAFLGWVGLTSWWVLGWIAPRAGVRTRSHAAFMAADRTRSEDLELFIFVVKTWWGWPVRYCGRASRHGVEGQFTCRIWKPGQG